ncbi:DUF3560 domain-containing protein [Actinophytocola xanthii]|uniref:DUF3560 domain-containing protein n=1 Tax=Actinophytocola xanthii TaxID=1912961 RepID=A0A1Q8C2J0_9PSEU|nr:DUF3560 domain-containing protein [Actinophytocola xanthii]OLF08562.1 hypothetical protein BU204_34280 [Actinophytocola xanthii]
MTVEITHTYAEGTLLSGLSKPETRKGTPVRQILDDNVWTWRPEPGWFQRSSRNQLPRQWRIDNTADRLRQLGYEVTVTIDLTVRDMDEIEQERAERLDDRADALDAKATRRASAGHARIQSANEFFSGIPMGQPVIGEADRRRRARHLHTEMRGYALLNQAESAADRADTARRHMDRRYHPRKVLRRIARLETDLRKTQRHLTNAAENGHEAARERLQAACDKLATELAYWQKIHDQQVADGQVRVFTRDDINPGDWVYSDWPGGPHRVARVNPTTVSIETQRIHGTDTWWTNKVPYYEITNVRHADPQPPGPPQPADAASTET